MTIVCTTSNRDVTTTWNSCFEWRLHPLHTPRHYLTVSNASTASPRDEQACTRHVGSRRRPQRYHIITCTLSLRVLDRTLRSIRNTTDAHTASHYDYDSHVHRFTPQLRLTRTRPRITSTTRTMPCITTTPHAHTFLHHDSDSRAHRLALRLRLTRTLLCITTTTHAHTAPHYYDSRAHHFTLQLRLTCTVPRITSTTRTMPCITTTTHAHTA